MKDAVEQTIILEIGNSISCKSELKTYLGKIKKKRRWAADEAAKQRRKKNTWEIFEKRTQPPGSGMILGTLKQEKM